MYFKKAVADEALENSRTCTYIHVHTVCEHEKEKK